MPFTRQQHFSLIQFCRFADDHAIMTEIVQSFFHRLENILGKGEKAGSQQFLQCFQSASLFTHSHTMTPFDAPGKQAF